MNSKKNSLHNIILPCFLGLLLFLSGCAQKEWRDPLAESEDKAAQQILQQMLVKQESCSHCFDAKVAATWKSRISDGGINGYLQILLPTSVKLVAINPLGQPLFAFSTDGRTFQTINTEEGIFKHGKIASFVRRHNIPDNLLHDAWGRWLTGRVEYDQEQGVQLHQDVTGRGFWLKMATEKKSYFAGEYLLIDPAGKRLVERVALDRDGAEAVRVIYKKWTEIDGCSLPAAIEIKSHSYGTTVALEMSEIRTDSGFEQRSFALKAPRGYLQQYYP